MKEAAGEANMTVITIVLIGLVAAVGAVLIPNLLTSTSKQACCTSVGGTWANGTCTRDGVTLAVENYYNENDKSCK